MTTPDEIIPAVIARSPFRGDIDSEDIDIISKASKDGSSVHLHFGKGGKIVGVVALTNASAIKLSDDLRKIVEGGS